jgi:hypothetical protein
MDKTLEITLRTGINTKLPTCDDKGVFTNDNDTYRKVKETQVRYGGQNDGRRQVAEDVVVIWT